MALSEFMPYGAPELLDGAASRLARATTVASLFVAALVVCTGVVLPRADVTLVHPDDILRELLPAPPEPAVTEPRQAAPARERWAPGALPVPVPDPLSPIDERVTESRGGEPSGVATGEASPVDASRLGALDVERDPDPFAGPVVDELPNLVRSVDPDYPDLAREAGVEGTVFVRMLVGRDGRVERAFVLTNRSVPMLDDSALVAALRCVFTPALTNGHPVKVWVSRAYRFRLH